LQKEAGLFGKKGKRKKEGAGLEAPVLPGFTAS
jgi:hypothetical protein